MINKGQRIFLCVFGVTAICVMLLRSQHKQVVRVEALHLAPPSPVIIKELHSVWRNSEVQIYCNFAPEFPETPLRTLSQAVKLAPKAEKIRIFWEQTALGSGDQDSVLYNRKQQSLEFFRSYWGYNANGSQHYAFQGITDPIIFTRNKKFIPSSEDRYGFLAFRSNATKTQRLPDVTLEDVLPYDALQKLHEAQRLRQAKR